MGGVELDDIVAGRNQSGHHGAVVVPGGLDPDPDRERSAGRNSRRQPGLQNPHSRLIERERQRLPNDLAAVERFVAQCAKTGGEARKGADA